MSMDWTGTLKALAPTIASALGGPFAGLAVAAIGKLFDVSDATQETIKDIIIGSKPEDLLKIKQAEQDFKLALRQLDVKETELEVQDRSSARTMWATGTVWIGALAFVTVAGFFASVWYILNGGIKNLDSNELLMVGTVIGYVAANTQSVYNYFFGSSRGSDQKSSQISALVTKGVGNG